ncbi:MAG: insulinase family protein [Treponema sp.]|nr:insulinase family protein [Candidatus Treponema equifaecale]
MIFSRKYKKDRSSILAFQFLIFFCVLTFFLASCASSKNSGNSFYADNIVDFRTEKLSNGIPVYFKQNHGSKVVVLRMVFEGGVVLYDSKIDGIEDFAFDLAFHGSKNYSYEDLQRLEFEKSFSTISSCSKDYSIAGFTCIARDLDLVTDVFADSILNPNMSESDFDQLYNLANQSLVSRKADPSSVLGLELSKLAYEDHPYAVSAQVQEKSISKLTLDAVKRHYETLLNPSRIKFFVVADMNVDETKEFAKKLSTVFASLEKKSYSKSSIPKPSVKGITNYAANQQAGETGYIAGLFECPDKDDSDYIPYALATLYLDDIFFEQVREKAGAVYFMGTGVVGGKHLLGAISAYKANNSKNLKQVIFDAINSLDESTIEKKLEQYKNKYITILFNSSQNAAGIAGNMISSLEYFGSETAYLRRSEKVQAVNAGQVYAAYEKYLKKVAQDGGASWAVVSNEESLKTFGF